MTYSTLPGVYVTTITNTANSIAIGNGPVPTNGIITIGGQTTPAFNTADAERAKQVNELMRALDIPIIITGYAPVFNSYDPIDSDKLYDLIMDPVQRKKLICKLKNLALL